MNRECAIYYTEEEKKELVSRFKHIALRVSKILHSHPKIREEVLVDLLLLLAECDDKVINESIGTRIKIRGITSSKRGEPKHGFDFAILIDRLNEKGEITCSKLDLIQVKKEDNDCINLKQKALTECKNILSVLNPNSKENIKTNAGEFMLITNDKIVVIPATVIKSFIDERGVNKYPLKEIINFARRSGRGYNRFETYVVTKLFQCKRGIVTNHKSTYECDDDSTIVRSFEDNSIVLKISQKKRKITLETKDAIDFTGEIFNINHLLWINVKSE